MADIDAAMVETGGASGVEGREDVLPVGSPGEVEEAVAVGAEAKTLT